MSTDEQVYLCINSGSSSLKLALYQFNSSGQEDCIWRASAQAIGTPDACIERDGQRQAYELPRHATALHVLLRELDTGRVNAVGHRVVHGGLIKHPERVTPELVSQLRTLVPVAPLHMPAALEGINAVSELLPDITQLACFDTAFHASLPNFAVRLALPQPYHRLGIRRYGFHGLSCEYIVNELANSARDSVHDSVQDTGRGRMIIAHLGSGASLTAVRDGRSVDTTMGFTPTGGIMMATRSGDLDPGVLLYLLREQKLDLNELNHLLEQEAGLLGVSGLSGDMTILLRHDDSESQLAVTMFSYQVRKAIGAFAAVLGGLDRLVFTGGIGEHAAEVRNRVCSGMDYLGIRLDPQRNAGNSRCISSDNSACEVLVIATDEDRMIARHCAQLLSGDYSNLAG